MAVAEMRDRAVIAGLCRRNPFLHVYELGDLDDFFWPHTRFVGWGDEGDLTQLALLYTEPEPPVLLALAEEPFAQMALLLGALLPELPARLYAHVTPFLLETIESRYDVESHGLHLKMGLTDTSRLGHAAVQLLGEADLDEVSAFYARAYPGTWFVPRMLETGRYVGIREGGSLACVAGVHVFSPTWRAAALGNVATLPELRGRGLATRACGALCRLLLRDGIDTIALNVRADNTPAIAAYRQLGFEAVGEYLEVDLTARGA
ncbi:MAG: GNAT family N-acetyltransferase [Gaiellaceae bacterium]